MAGFQEGTNIKKIKIGNDVRHIGADATNIDLKGVSYNDGKKLEGDLTDVVTNLKNLNDNNYRQKSIVLGAENNGTETYANREGAIAIGYSVKAKGQYSQAFGYRTIADGEGAHAGGYQSEANGDNSFVHGKGLVANNKNEFVIGQYNSVSNSQQYRSLFAIGGGIAENIRNNILQISIPTTGVINANNPAQMNAPFVESFFNNTTIYGKLKTTSVPGTPPRNGEIETPILKVTEQATLPYHEDKYEYVRGTGQWTISMPILSGYENLNNLNKFAPYSTGTEAAINSSYIYIRKWGNIVNIEGQLTVKDTENTTDYDNGFALFHLYEACSPKIRLAQVCHGSGDNHFLIDIRPKMVEDKLEAVLHLCRYGKKSTDGKMSIVKDSWLPFNITYFVDDNSIIEEDS